MEDLSQVRDELNKVITYDDFFSLRQSLARFTDSELFGALFPIAIDGREDRAPHLAGCALVELQPDCPCELVSLLTQIHSSNLFASYREVPFYLVTQFGKHAVLNGAGLFLASISLEPKSHSRVESILYWAAMPASELCRHFHDWRADEMSRVDQT